MFRPFAAKGGVMDHVTACGALSAAGQTRRRHRTADVRPFCNFHAIKFNANTVLTPFWALAIRNAPRRMGILAGIAAAAAMLAKYWSITLLAGVGVAALSDPRRYAYFSSPAPYVTLAVGIVLLTPNIRWLATHAFMPFSYAMQAHSGTTLALFSALIFAGDGCLCGGGDRLRCPGGPSKRCCDPRHAVAVGTGAPHARHRVCRAVCIRHTRHGRIGGDQDRTKACHRLSAIPATRNHLPSREREIVSVR
jgi:hypothetical protein